MSLTAAQSVNDTTALGKIPNSVFEVSTGASNSYYANGTSITLSASNANVYLRASSGLSLSGGSDWVDGLGSGDPVSLSGSDNNWDYVTATGATITLNGAQTSVAGGGDTINYASGNGNAVDIYKTGGSADTVTATGSAIYLNSAQAHVTGGGDWVDFQSGSGNAVTLAGTSNNWDWVTAADATVDFDGAQATVAGGGDTIAFQSGSGNSLAITGTGGSADAITASASNIYMLGAEATVTGGGDWVDFQGGTDSVKLANTRRRLGLGDGSGRYGRFRWRAGDRRRRRRHDRLYWRLGQLCRPDRNRRLGRQPHGLQQRHLSSWRGSGRVGRRRLDRFPKRQRYCHADRNRRQLGLGDGHGRNCKLEQRAKRGSGRGRHVGAHRLGQRRELIDTGGSADSVNGANGLLYLNGAQAAVTGNSDTFVMTGGTATASGNSDSFVFLAAFGQDSVTGFNSTDTIQLAASDFASWNVLQGHITQSGANTLITLDATDAITLVGVTKSSLSQSEFSIK